MKPEPVARFQIHPIEAASTALIVIDVQNNFLEPGAPLESVNGRAMVSTLRRAIAFCRERAIPVIYTKQTYRKDGSDRGLAERFWNPTGDATRLVEGEHLAEIYPPVGPLEGDVVIVKRRYSAFYGTDLELVLRGKGVGTVIIAGLTTENCCHATARDAFFRDFEVGFLSDATATFDYPDRGYGSMSASAVHEATLVVLAASTAHVMTTDEFIREVVGVRR